MGQSMDATFAVTFAWWRRLGHLLKITISQPSERARAAQKMAILRTTHACAKAARGGAVNYVRRGVTYENVLPNRRGVLRATRDMLEAFHVRVHVVAHLIRTSELHLSHWLCFMMAGREVDHSPL